MIETGIYVVVTTSYRDVWWGRLSTRNPDKSVVLVEARHGFRWDTTAGIGQLTTDGPGPKAQIGATLFGRLEIADVVGIMECSPRAVEAWRSAGWYIAPES